MNPGGYSVPIPVSRMFLLLILLFDLPSDVCFFFKKILSGIGNMIICTDLISFVVSAVIYFSRLRLWQMNQLGITGFFVWINFE